MRARRSVIIGTYRKKGVTIDIYRPKDEIYIGDSRHRCKEKQHRSKGHESDVLEKHAMSSKSKRL